jgi:hypothetical protein
MYARAFIQSSPLSSQDSLKSGFKRRQAAFLILEHVIQPGNKEMLHQWGKIKNNCDIDEF